MTKPALSSFVTQFGVLETGIIGWVLPLWATLATKGRPRTIEDLVDSARGLTDWLRTIRDALDRQRTSLYSFHSFFTPHLERSPFRVLHMAWPSMVKVTSE